MKYAYQQQRRQQLAQAMAAQGGGVAVVLTGAEVPRNRDSEYPYRWDSYFYYLTGFPEPEACVVVVAATATEPAKSILFSREKNEEREIWDGFRFGPDAARALFGFDETYPIGQLGEVLPKLLANQPALYAALASSPDLDERVRTWLSAVRAQTRSGVSAPSQLRDVCELLDEFRLFKDESELTTMRHAAAISADAHCHAMRVAVPGSFEYAVEAELIYRFRKAGAQSVAYGSIVAAGGNACVLHYRGNDQPLRDGDLLLIDAGCELDGYASDITRTFPINGKFSAAQADVYQIVLDAQLAAIDATRPGNTFMAPHDAAVRVLVQGMIDLKLCQGTVDGVTESGDFKRFYMHRTGHWLGMDVHDCGSYREPGAPQSATPAQASRVLQPGMVLTVEPGLYIRPADNVPEALWNIGIRIEDDAVVNASGCEIMTHGVPKTIANIEALIRDGRSANPTSASATP